MYEIKNKSVKRGGKRLGAGRKSLYGVPTKAIRVPENMVAEVRDFIESQNAAEYELPLFASKVAAGFPSPADDFMDTKLDLNTHLIKHPSATFFVKATGDSMIGAGIHEGDILVVDRSLEPRNGKIIIAAVDGSLTVKRLVKNGKNTMLSPENNKYKPIKLTENNDIIIWGVVTNVIHKV